MVNGGLCDFDQLWQRTQSRLAPGIIHEESRSSEVMSISPGMSLLRNGLALFIALLVWGMPKGLLASELKARCLSAIRTVGIVTFYRGLTVEIEG